LDTTVQSSRGRALTTGPVVFLVIAAAAPLTAVVGNIPLALVYGNGAGLPVVFALACLVLLCFAVGYAEMSRRVVNTGAFYTYVGSGLGRPPAVAAGYLAAVSYTALTTGLAGAVGYFVHLVLAAVDIHVPWIVATAVALMIVATLGYRSVTLSAKVVGVLITLELAIVALMDFGILAHRGLAALPSASLSPHQVLGGSLGIGLMFAFTSFVGFESAALYGEETADPRRSVPRATYVALIGIGLFYFGTAWLTVGAIGVANTHDIASRDLGNLLFNVAEKYLGTGLSQLMAVLVCTSLLAAMLAFHNVASRYLFALGRDRVLPARLGHYHARHLSPHVASVTVSVISTLVAGIFAVAGLDPYLTLAASMVGLSTLGVLLLQVLAAVSVVVFFLRYPDGTFLRTVFVPALGAVGLLTGFLLAVVHFSTLIGTTNRIVGSLPAMLVVVMVAGFFAGLWLRSRRPGDRPSSRDRGDHLRHHEPLNQPLSITRGGS
jgi:amino acid transporter